VCYHSGKTHEALSRLKSAQSGVYCGPLRLLAEEVYRKMNDEHSVPCHLRTGQRQVDTQGANHISCTVEMADISREVDCAVIDEIQMIGDRLVIECISLFDHLKFFCRDRGWAWSRALLGIPAKEVHLCGNESVLDIVKSLCVSTGEKLEVRR